MIDGQHKDVVFDYLNSFCLGRSRSIKADDLAQIFNSSRREINNAVRELRKDGRIVGSSKEKPFGYYIPITTEEVREYLNSFRNELFDMLHTYNLQRRAQRSFIYNVNNKSLFPTQLNDAGQMELVLTCAGAR